MPAPYAGNGTIPTVTYGARTRGAISSWTNTTPITVTGGSGSFNTGDTVEIEGTGVIDGQYQITITNPGPPTFVLNGTVAPGSAGSGVGYVYNYQIQPAMVLPNSGDLAQAGDVSIVGQAASNVIPFLYRLQGKWRIFDIFQGGTTSAGVSTSLPNGGAFIKLVNNALNLGSLPIIPAITQNVDLWVCYWTMMVGAGNSGSAVNFSVWPVLGPGAANGPGAFPGQASVAVTNPINNTAISGCSFLQAPAITGNPPMQLQLYAAQLGIPAGSVALTMNSYQVLLVQLRGN